MAQKFLQHAKAKESLGGSKASKQALRGHSVRAMPCGLVTAVYFDSFVLSTLSMVKLKISQHTIAETQN